MLLEKRPTWLLGLSLTKIGQPLPPLPTNAHAERGVRRVVSAFHGATRLSAPQVFLFGTGPTF